MNEKDLEKELGLVVQNDALRKQVIKLESKLESLEKILKENDLYDELEQEPKLGDIEFICLDQIKKLKLICEQGEVLDVGQVKNLQTLHSILTQIRTGKEPKESKKSKKMDVSELFNIVNGKQ